MKRNFLLIVEINDAHCKLLRAKPLRQGYQVTSLTTVKIDHPSREAVEKLLSAHVSAADKRARCVAVLPRQQVILKNLSLPSQAKDELRKMIDLQITTQVPYAREDIIFDYIVLGQDQSGYTKVLVAIVHRDVIDEIFKTLKGAGLAAQQFVLSSASIASWINTVLKKDWKDPSGVLAALVPQKDTSELCLIKNRQLVYAREIKHGLRDVGGDFEDAFLKDISLTLESFKREHLEAKIDKFLILAPQLSGRLFDTLRMQKDMDVRFVDPCVFFPQAAAVSLPQMHGDDYASPVVCLGAVEESQKVTFNFLPESIRQAQQKKIRQRQFLRLCALLTANLLLAGLIIFHQVMKEEKSLDALNQELVGLRSRVEEINLAKEQISLIEEQMRPSVSAIDILSSLYEFTPREVSFQLLWLDRSNRLVVQGISEARSHVNDFQRDLVSSPLFQDVSLEYAAQRRFFEGEITDFKITATVNRNQELP